ncbi:hypothetical protein EVAR_94294_1 [Eumeta japonica]|uniref:Uncharacterized protein n=1 Tax=Eumeta variegata TaxID=151549 RepID=A0A4C1UFS8_EUMVA|nr:hypothetical protein EVAR_94294_1 [Eumeta japonica]
MTYTELNSKLCLISELNRTHQEEYSEGLSNVISAADSVIVPFTVNTIITISMAGVLAPTALCPIYATWAKTKLLCDGMFYHQREPHLIYTLYSSILNYDNLSRNVVRRRPGAGLEPQRRKRSFKTETAAADENTSIHFRIDEHVPQTKETFSDASKIRR